MSWPTLEESVRTVDISWWQNSGWPLRNPFDVDQFCELNPDVELAILRLNWPGGPKDSHYDHYYEGFVRNGRKVAAYVWPDTIERWKLWFGDRVPKMICSDHETHSGNQGQTRDFYTSELHRTQENLRLAFPSATVLARSPYSRGNWLDEHILPSERVNNYRWWLAHYPYPPHLGGNRQVRSFAELDPILPIDNDFTPYRGRNHNIPPENVVGWQASDRAELPGTHGRIDIGYWRRAHIAVIYDEELDDPPTEPELVRIEVSGPEGSYEIVQA